MTVGEAIKLLESKGSELLNQRGSHKKYGKGDLRVIVIYHSKPKEILTLAVEKKVKEIIKQSKINSDV